jgi:hypothetical protein
MNSGRPARPVPRPAIPAHIHPLVNEPDRNEYNLEEFVFVATRS